MAGNTARTSETGKGLFQAVVDTGGITFLADEPTEVGGLGTGPGPYELLCASLATCTSMTIRFYAQRHAIHVGPIDVVVKHAKNTDGKDVFDRKIELADVAGPAQRDALLRAAKGCPVSRTLEQGSIINTELK
ncbi:OsmC family protein [Rhizobium mesosinicum]|uniref:OsmC family protein n=1 Tax=Rhizobium mesosinicum TaxID=335017 RepID=A0ABS7GM59_9HYPH|nr:OsmC family protein [Rhizobium mesosinicum]MBW9051065.1 OsmC family protein [Rhizobium mesosinicum]